MAVVPGVHRANDGDVIDDARRVRQQFRYLGAAATVPGELPRTAEELLAGTIDEAENDIAGVILAVVLAQLRLGIEQIDMRRTAVHEQRDHRRRLRREVRLPRLQIQRQVFAGLLGNFGEGVVALEEMRQGERADAEGGTAQEFTPSRDGRINPHRGTRWRIEAAGTGRSMPPVRVFLPLAAWMHGALTIEEAAGRGRVRPARSAADRRVARPSRDASITLGRCLTAGRRFAQQAGGRSGRPAGERNRCSSA